jgi:hypothetical protein
MKKKLILSLARTAFYVTAYALFVFICSGFAAHYFEMDKILYNSGSYSTFASFMPPNIGFMVHSRFFQIGSAYHFHALLLLELTNSTIWVCVATLVWHQFVRVFDEDIAFWSKLRIPAIYGLVWFIVFGSVILSRLPNFESFSNLFQYLDGLWVGTKYFLLPYVWADLRGWGFALHVCASIFFGAIATVIQVKFVPVLIRLRLRTRSAPINHLATVRSAETPKYATRDSCL